MRGRQMRSFDGATRLPRYTVAEAITLPRIPWAEITTGMILVLVAEAAEAGDRDLVARAKAALARRSRQGHR
jgi:hypothetical protein